MQLLLLNFEYSKCVIGPRLVTSRNHINSCMVQKTVNNDHAEFIITTSHCQRILFRRFMPKCRRLAHDLCLFFSSSIFASIKSPLLNLLKSICAEHTPFFNSSFPCINLQAPFLHRSTSNVILDQSVLYAISEEDLHREKNSL